jgi:hypothetical protein
VTEQALSPRTRAVGAAFRLMLGAAVIAMLGLLVVNSVTARDARAKQAAPTALIKSCVDPDGQCFQEAAQRQADLIGDPPAPINNVVILAAACADRDGVDTESQIRECVLEGLRR